MTLSLCSVWLQLEVSMTPATGPVNLLGRLTELRETVTFTILLKNIKDTDRWRDIQSKVWEGRAPNTGASISVELGCVTLLV